MAERPGFNIIAAAFYFLVVLFRRPVSTLWVVGLASGAVLLAAWLGETNAIRLAGEAAEATGKTPMPEPAEIFAAGGLLFLAIILFELVLAGAVLRLMTRGETAAGLPFRLWTDEGRLALVWLVFFALFFVAAFGLMMLAMAAVIPLMVIAGDGAPAAMMAAMFVVYGVMLLAGLYFYARLSPAAALTVRDRKFRFFEAWGATRRVGWGMVAAYLVLFIVLVAAALAVDAARIIEVFGALRAGRFEDFPAFAEAFSLAAAPVNFADPAAIGHAMALAVFEVVSRALLLGPAAYVAVKTAGFAALTAPPPQPFATESA